MDTSLCPFGVRIREVQLLSNFLLETCPFDKYLRYIIFGGIVGGEMVWWWGDPLDAIGCCFRYYKWLQLLLLLGDCLSKEKNK